MTDKNILIADIGGTNARFALVGETAGEFSNTQVFQCAEYETVELALNDYLEQQQIESLDAICFAAAGPILNQTIKMTNNHWFIDMEALKQKFGAAASRLLNDFEANSYALTSLRSDQVRSVGKDWPLPESEEFNLGILGPGSGLGVGGLVRRNGKEYSLVTEGGHTGFSPENSQQLEVLQVLHSKYSRVSNERLLSGPGLVNLYQAICQIESVQPNELSASAIGQKATEGNEPQCQKALELFFEVLGQVAGDIALIQGAFDGIYIGGGICQRYPEQLMLSKFRAGFENKGRHSHLLEATPTWLITEPSPGLIGASSFASKNLIDN